MSGYPVRDFINSFPTYIDYLNYVTTLGRHAFLELNRKSEKEIRKRKRTEFYIIFNK